MKNTIKTLLALGLFVMAQTFGFAQLASTEPEAAEVAVKPAILNFDEVKHQIVYPVQSRKMGMEGTVYIKVLVNEEGKVAKHEVLKSPCFEMVQACVGELEHLRFEPAKNDAGENIACWVTVPFRFSIKI